MRPFPFGLGRFALGAGLAALLAGCSSAGFDGPAARSVPQDAGTFLQITAQGAGPLNGSTPYSSKAILALMPDYTTGSVIIGLENSTPDATVLFRKAYGGQVQALQILPGPGGRIGQIHGVTHHVVGPAGERPGMTFRETGTDPSTCRIGTNLWLGMAICRSRGASNVTLTFSFKGEAAMSTSLPPREVLDQGELQRIIWTPPA